MLRNSVLRCLYKNYPLRRGKHFLRSFFKYISGYVIIEDDDKNILLLNLDNYIDSKIYLEGSYEKININTLKKICSNVKCDYFIDIGANLGIYTINFSKESYIKECYCFEPDPQNYSQLSANVFLNDIGHKVKMFNYALSDVTEEGTLFLEKEKKDIDLHKCNAGTHSLEENKNRHNDKIKVKVFRGDELLDIKNQTICIKIDVEGHELSVLKGLERKLLLNNTILMIEIFDDKFKETIKYLENIGFKIDTSVNILGVNYLLKNFDFNA